MTQDYLINTKTTKTYKQIQLTLQKLLDKSKGVEVANRWAESDHDRYLHLLSTKGEEIIQLISSNEVMNYCFRSSAQMPNLGSLNYRCFGYNLISYKDRLHA